jgi:hypothetical protein
VAITIKPGSTDKAFMADEAPSTNSGETTGLEPITVPAETPEQIERLRRLLERSLDPEGLDWDALSRLDTEAWGAETE